MEHTLETVLSLSNISWIPVAFVVQPSGVIGVILVWLTILIIILFGTVLFVNG